MPVGLRRDGWMVPCLQDCRLLCSQSIWAEFIHPFIHLRLTPKIKCSEWDLLRGKELKDTGMELLRVALCPSEAFSVSSFQKNDFWMDEALQQSLWVMKTNTVYNCTPPRWTQLQTYWPFPSQISSWLRWSYSIWPPSSYTAFTLTNVPTLLYALDKQRSSFSAHLCPMILSSPRNPSPNPNHSWSLSSHTICPMKLS